MKRLIRNVCLIVLTAASTSVATPATNAALNLLSADSQLIANWFAGTMRQAAPFGAMTGDVMPEPLKLWHWDAGVTGAIGATPINQDSLHNLPTTLVNVGEIDFIDWMPLPTIVAHAAVGLPFGLQGTIRVGGFPETTFGGGDTDNGVEGELDPGRTQPENKDELKLKTTLVGFGIGKTLIESGETRPFGLAASLLYTHNSGQFDFPVDAEERANSTITSGGKTYDVMLDGQASNHVEWKTDSVGLQLVANRRVLFMNPYVGGMLQRNWGTLTNRLNGTGTVTLTPQTSGPQESASIADGIDASARPAGWTARLLAGIEFSVFHFVQLGLEGEYGSAGSLGGALNLSVRF